MPPAKDRGLSIIILLSFGCTPDRVLSIDARFDEERACMLAVGLIDAHHIESWLSCNTIARSIRGNELDVLNCLIDCEEMKR